METITKKEVKVWTLDAAHSNISFIVKHMVISQAKGSFTNFTLKVETQGLDFSDAKIELEINVKSISTISTDRDNHLLSADFFDAEKYPTIKFVSKSMTKLNDKEYVLTGDLTMKGITKPIELEVSYGGQIIDPYGNVRSGFNILGSLDRFDFGLKWNSLLETGNAILGKKVNIQADIELSTPK